MRVKNTINCLSKSFFVFLGLVAIMSCSNGNKEVVEYYNSSEPKLVYFTKVEDGVTKRVGEKMYYESGQTMYEGRYKNDERIGHWAYYFENGSLFCRMRFDKEPNSFEVFDSQKNRLITGKDNIVEANYYPNGALAKIRKTEGEREVEYRFYTNFNLFEKRTTKKDLLDGEVLSYHESGQLSSKSHYNNGVQDGDYHLYYENGNLRLKGKVDNGIRVGVWEYYKESGEEDGQEEYSEDGSLIKHRDTGLRYFDKDGNEIIFE